MRTDAVVAREQARQQRVADPLVVGGIEADEFPEVGDRFLVAAERPEGLGKPSAGTHVRARVDHRPEMAKVAHKSIAEVTLAGGDTLTVERDRFGRRLRRLLGEEDVAVGAVGGDGKCFAGQPDTIAAGGIPRVVHQVLRSLHRRSRFGNVARVQPVDVRVEEALSVNEGGEVLVAEEGRRCRCRRRRPVAVLVLALAAAWAEVIASWLRHGVNNPTESA